MLQNYFKIALRNLAKYRFYSVINITGLTVGMICFLFIFMYIKDECSYDQFHANIDRLYRLHFFAKLGDQIVHSSASPKPIGPTFKQEIPEIEEFCRLRRYGNYVVRYDNQVYKEENVVFADSTMFKVFSFKMLDGDPATALAQPHAVVLTKQAAEKYFGNENPIGKTLFFEEDAVKVTGVVENQPTNAHFQFDFFRSIYSLNMDWDESWGSTNHHNYFLLRKGADIGNLSEKATAIFVKNFIPILKEYLNSTWEEFVNAGNYARVEFTPVKDIHLHSDLDDELGANGDIKYVYIFSIIGLFILFLACINFMNLATARSSIRAKEVGVRKAAGALRSDLVKQFLSESIVMGLTALLLSFAALHFLLPAFNNLAEKELTASDFFTPSFVVTAVLLVVMIGIIAGSYPAFFLSAFQPANVLKGSFSQNAIPLKGSGSIRSGLVVFQFFTTTVLVIGSLVVYQQLQYIHNKKLGFNKENVLILHDAYQLGSNLAAFKERMLQNPSVSSASVCNFLPVTSDRNTSTIVKGRNVSQENTILSNNWWVDYGYAETMGLEIAEGRDFSKDIASDSSAVIVNETLARLYGYPQKPVIGEEVNFQQEDGRLEIHTITGVVKDFNFASLRNNIEPLAIFRADVRGNIAFRIETKDVEAFIKILRGAWDEMAPAKPFAYTFLDERFDRLYASETRIGKVIGTFAFLAIFIACIGLLGLAAFMTQQRTKEIGVRKVLGASVTSIVALLSKDFLKLVVVSIVVAAPVAWYFMKKWLEDFAYRIDIHWWIFMVAGAAAVLVAFLTVSFQSVKAALANPVESLRSE